MTDTKGLTSPITAAEYAAAVLREQADRLDAKASTATDTGMKCAYYDAAAQLRVTARMLVKGAQQDEAERVEEPAEPRTWRAGDPEPDDFPTVASPSGANEFAHREGGWFHTSGCTCCVDIPWDVLVRQCGPLSEVTSTEAGAR